MLADGWLFDLHAMNCMKVSNPHASKQTPQKNYTHTDTHFTPRLNNAVAAAAANI